MADQQNLKKMIRSLMPKQLRHQLMRHHVSVDQIFPPQLSFRLACTEADLSAAYAILHDAYVSMKYMDPHPSGMRLTKYFALPTTSTLVALWDDQVVGTVSIIRESPVGLPMGTLFDLSNYDQRKMRIAEVSALAIKKEFRMNAGKILFPLCKFFYDYARFYLNLDAVVIAVNPSWIDFYEGLFMFDQLNFPVVDSYGFVKGAPAVAMALEMKKSEIDFARCFSHLPPRQNLHQYFVLNSLPTQWFPERQFRRSFDSVMTPAMLQYFFKTKSQVFSELTLDEWRHIRNAYPPHFFQKDQQQTVLQQPPATRFAVDLKPIEHPYVLIQNVSRQGLLLTAQDPIEMDQPTSIRIEVGPNKISSLKVRQAWQSQNNHEIGTMIINADPVWNEYIAYLERSVEIVPGPIPRRTA